MQWPSARGRDGMAVALLIGRSRHRLFCLHEHVQSVRTRCSRRRSRLPRRAHHRPGRHGGVRSYLNERARLQAAVINSRPPPDAYPSTDSGSTARFQEAVDRWSSGMSPPDRVSELIKQAATALRTDGALGLAEAQARDRSIRSAINSLKDVAQHKDGPLPVDGFSWSWVATIATPASAPMHSRPSPARAGVSESRLRPNEARAGYAHKHRRRKPRTIRTESGRAAPSGVEGGSGHDLQVSASLEGSADPHEKRAAVRDAPLPSCPMHAPNTALRGTSTPQRRPATTPHRRKSSVRERRTRGPGRDRRPRRRPHGWCGETRPRAVAPLRARHGPP